MQDFCSDNKYDPDDVPNAAYQWLTQVCKDHKAGKLRKSRARPNGVALVGTANMHALG